jgi:hypothetical protein
MPDRCWALRCPGTSASTRRSSASESEYPNMFVAAGFHSNICWVSAPATITASRTLSKSLPIPEPSGRIRLHPHSTAGPRAGGVLKRDHVAVQVVISP